MESGLYVVGTPIGHLGDVTLRALETLRGADLVFAEDTRITLRLFARHGIATRLQSCHKFNEAARVEQAVARIRAGGRVALVTDSGMPGVSDPGARVVAACRAAGLRVTVVPGPSALATAVAWSGFGGAGFVFGGFLPHRGGPRARRLDALLGGGDAVVLYESPYRVLRLLEELERLAPARPVFVAREMTKQFEEGLAGTPAELLAHFRAHAPRGEFVVIVGPAGRDAEPDPTPGDPA
jgi:16S rRNA (cytidine1402-2'-O)-methyltransferase